MKSSFRADILSNPEVVFSWIDDPSKALQWQKDVKGGEIIKDTPGKIGTTFKEVMEENGKSLEMTGEITDYIPDRLISFRLESRIHKVLVKYSVEGEPGKSVVLIDLVIKWKFPMSVISMFMGSKIKSKIVEQTNSELSELKRLCENRY